MRYLLLLLTLFTLAGCEEPQTFEDTPDMSIRQTRNPPVLPAPSHGIPQVVPTIPRNGLWSGYNQLGYQAKYGPDQRATQTILKLDEWGAPEVWTVSLYVKNDLKTYNGFRIKARINFGAGGSTQVYECDWLNGTQISLPLNAVNVEAIFSDVDAATEGAGLSVGVQLSRGPRGGTTPPILVLEEDIVIASTTVAIYDLPAFARAVVFVPGQNTAGGLASIYSSTTELFTLSGNDIGAFRTSEVRGDRSVGGLIRVPVVGSARRVRIANGDAGNDIEGTLYVELDG